MATEWLDEKSNPVPRRDTGHRTWTQIIFSSSKEWIFPEPFKFFYPVPHVIYDKCGGRVIITAKSSIYQMLSIGYVLYSSFNPHKILVKELLPSPLQTGVLCEEPKVTQFKSTVLIWTHIWQTKEKHCVIFHLTTSTDLAEANYSSHLSSSNPVSDFLTLIMLFLSLPLKRGSFFSMESVFIRLGPFLCHFH